MHARILVSATLIGLLATIGCDPTEEAAARWTGAPRVVAAAGAVAIGGRAPIGRP